MIQPGPTDLQTTKDRLTDAFPDACIDHIGSTAVPGLAAKPIIDMQVGLANLDSFEPAMLEGTGFVPSDRICSDDPIAWISDNPDDWRKRYARLEEDGNRLAHLHIRQIGRPNHRCALLFRDFLRVTPDVRDLYAEMKEQAARYGAASSETGGTGPYLDLKSPFVNLVLWSAERWAAQTGWCISDQTEGPQ